MSANSQTQELLQKINSTPSLLNCLYDLGLMPEQLDIDSDKWKQMVIISVHWPTNNER